MATLIALQVAAFALLNWSLIDFWDVCDAPQKTRKAIPQCFVGVGLAMLALCVSGIHLMKS